jgi:hypothetical protein
MPPMKLPSWTKRKCIVYKRRSNAQSLGACASMESYPVKKIYSLWADTMITSLRLLFFTRASPPRSSDASHRPLQHLPRTMRKLHPKPQPRHPGLSHGGGTYYHSGNSTPGHVQRGRSSRRRIRWPWWLEPSSNASTPAPTSSTSSRSGSGSSRPRSVGRFKTTLKPVPFINLESDDEDGGDNTEQPRSANAKFA